MRLKKALINLKLSSGVISSERVVKSRISANKIDISFSTAAPNLTSTILSYPKKDRNSWGTNRAAASVSSNSESKASSKW